MPRVTATKVQQPSAWWLPNRELVIVLRRPISLDEFRLMRDYFDANRLGHSGDTPCL